MIEIYEKTGFANLALEAKKEYVARYGRHERVPPRQPRGLGQGAAARQDAPGRAGAPLSRDRAEDQGERRLPGGGALVPRVPGVVPERSGGGAEQLPARRAAVRGRAASPRRASSTRRPPTAIRSTTKSADAGYARAARLSPRSSRRRAPAEQPALQRASVASALRFAQTLPGRHRAPARCSTDAAEKLYALKDDRPGRARSRSGSRAEAAGRRRAAPRRLDGARAHAFDKSAFDGAEKALRRGDQADARERCRRAPTWSSARRPPIYKQGEQARAGGKTREAVGQLRARRDGRAAVGGARQRAVRRRRRADRAEGLGRRDQARSRTSAQRFPNHALQAEVSKQARGRLPREGPVGAAPPASSSASPVASKDPKHGARRALAGRRAVREGQRHAAARPRPTSATSRRTRSRWSRRSRRAGGWRRSPRTTATRRARRR